MHISLGIFMTSARVDTYDGYVETKCFERAGKYRLWVGDAHEEVLKRCRSNEC